MTIIRDKGESIESLLFRWSKVKDEKVGELMSRHSFFINKSQRKRIKIQRAKRRLEK
jgi:ribosomal protein S21